MSTTPLTRLQRTILMEDAFKRSYHKWQGYYRRHKEVYTDIENPQFLAALERANDALNIAKNNIDKIVDYYCDQDPNLV